MCGVHFNYINICIELSRLLRSGEGGDLELRVYECFEDIKSKHDRGLVKMSVILLEISLVGTRTPGIVTELISM